MLADKKIKAFVPTVMPSEAKTFYKDILGLKFLSQDEYALEFDSGGVLLRIAIVPELKAHSFTVLGWNVNDIVDTMKSLKKEGVTFERYGFLKQDELGIWVSPGGSKVAWFKDPDGNILSLTE